MLASLMQDLVMSSTRPVESISMFLARMTLGADPPPEKVMKSVGCGNPVPQRLVDDGGMHPWCSNSCRGKWRKGNDLTNLIGSSLITREQILARSCSRITSRLHKIVTSGSVHYFKDSYVLLRAVQVPFDFLM